MFPLLTNRIEKHLARSVKIGAVFQAHPYQWDRISRIPKLHSSHLARMTWTLNTALVLVYSVFMFCRVAWHALSGDSSNAWKMFTGCVTAMYSVMTMLSVTLLLKYDQLDLFLARTITFLRNYRLQNTCGSSRPVRQCDLFLTFAFCSFTSSAVSLMTAAVCFPHTPELLSSLYTEADIDGAGGGKIPLWLKLVSAGFQWYILYLYTSYSSLMAIGPFAFMLCLKVVLHDLEAQNTSTIGNKIHTYNQLRLLVTEFNSNYCYVMLAFELTFIFIIVLATFCAVRTTGLLRLIGTLVTFLFTTFLITVFNFLADVHQRSEVTIAKLKSDSAERPNGKEEPLHLGLKVLRTLKPLRVMVGKLYFIDKVILMTLCNILVVSAVDVLIMVGGLG